MWHISCATYAHMPAGVRAGDVHSNFDKRDGETGALARRLPVVPGRPCPSRPSRRRVRRARRACRHRRPRRARRPRPAHGDPHSSREPPGPTDVAISAGTPRTPSSGFRDPEMSRMCRGPTVDSKNAGIHTRTPGRRGPTVVDRGPRDDLPPASLRQLCGQMCVAKHCHSGVTSPNFPE